MTEMTVNNDLIRAAHTSVPYSPKGYFWMPRHRPARYLVDPVAFVIALIGGPLLITAATFWMLFIPVGALIMGGPVYLVIGTPLLLIYLRNNAGDTKGVMQLSLFAVLGLCVGGGIISLILAGSSTIGLIAGLSIFAAIFAPLWAGGFGWIYFKLRKDMYAQPLPTHF